MYSALKKQINKNMLVLEKAEQDIQTQRERLQELAQQQIDVTIIQKFFQKSAEAVQQRISAKMEEVVQAALDICFTPGEFKFTFRFMSKRGKTEPDIQIVHKGHSESPQEAYGGSLIDIISFGLKLSVLSLRPVEKVLFMDEPFKFLDTQRQVKITQLLRDLSHQLNMQLVIITHKDDLKSAADTLFVVDKIDGTSVVEVISS